VAVASDPYYRSDCMTHGLVGITVMLQTRSFPQALPEKHEYSTDAKTWPTKVCTLTLDNLAYSTTPRCTRCWECGMQSECTQIMIYRVSANNRQQKVHSCACNSPACAGGDTKLVAVWALNSTRNHALHPGL
jgi:hypothetical protein